MGRMLEWTTGSRGLRHGFREEARYALPPVVHAGAAAIVAASPVLATVMVLCAALLAV